MPQTISCLRASSSPFSGEGAGCARRAAVCQRTELRRLAVPGEKKYGLEMVEVTFMVDDWLWFVSVLFFWNTNPFSNGYANRFLIRVKSFINSILYLSIIPFFFD